MSRINFALIALLLLWPMPTLAAQAIILTGNLTKTSYREGQPVVLVLNLHNSSTDKFTAAFEASAFTFTVTNSLGKSVSPTALGTRLQTPPMAISRYGQVSLVPGQSQPYRFSLARMFDLSRPGDYWVQASAVIQGVKSPLTAGLFKIHMAEDVSTYSGPTALMQPPTHSTFLYVANQYGGTVVRLRIGDDGKLSQTLAAPSLAGEGSGAIAVTPDGRFLYVSNGSVGTDYTVSQFRIGTGGELTSLSPAKVPAQKFPGSLLMDPKGRFLYALSGWGSTFYAIGPNGQLTETGGVSSGIGAGSGEESIVPMNFRVIDAAGKYLYGVGGKSYQIAPNGRLTTLKPSENSSGGANDWGDTALALSPKGRSAFALIEKSTMMTDENRVEPCQIAADGRLVLLPGSHPAETPQHLTFGTGGIVLDPKGRFVLQFSTSPNLIACYQVAPDGSLKTLGLTRTSGQPIAMLFGPNGHTVYTLNRNDNSVSTFRLDDHGRLTKLGLDTAMRGQFGIAFATASVPATQRPRLGVHRPMA